MSKKDDPHTYRTWSTRVRDLRQSTRYSVIDFARIIGLSPDQVRNIERNRRGTYIPHITTIRKIRLLERAFAEPLRKYRNFPGSKVRRAIVVVDYERFGGYRKIRKVIKNVYRTGLGLLPTDPADIEALGGMEVFRPSVTASRTPSVKRREYGRKLARIAQRTREAKRAAKLALETDDAINKLRSDYENHIYARTG